jgi:hypothetical protein
LVTTSAGRATAASIQPAINPMSRRISPGKVKEVAAMLKAIQAQEGVQAAKEKARMVVES